MYQPNRCFPEGQNMKSSTASPLMEFVVTPYFFVCTHWGPTPIIKSTLFDSVQGFLNSRSTSHSVVCLLKSGVTPASSSSHFSIGVTSTATVGPKAEPPSLTFQLAAPPNSTMAAGSFSADCAKAFPVPRNNAAIMTGRVTFTG